MKILRQITPYLAVVIAIGLIYDGWIFYSRWSDARAAKAAETDQEVAHAQKVMDLLGGDEVKILSFAASKGTLRPGEHTTLCYGVNGAAKVRVDPELPNTYPGLSNCVDIAPWQMTTYRIVAEDKAGQAVDASLTINVRR